MLVGCWSVVFVREMVNASTIPYFTSVPSYRSLEYSSDLPRDVEFVDTLVVAFFLKVWTRVGF
jgi:hypothetical protein